MIWLIVYVCVCVCSCVCIPNVSFCVSGVCYQCRRKKMWEGMFDIKKIYIHIIYYVYIVSMPNKITSVCKTINLTKSTSPNEEAEYLVFNDSNKRLILHFIRIYNKYERRFFRNSRKFVIKYRDSVERAL